MVSLGVSMKMPLTAQIAASEMLAEPLITGRVLRDRVPSRNAGLGAARRHGNRHCPSGAMDQPRWIHRKRNLCVTPLWSFIAHSLT